MTWLDPNVYDRKFLHPDDLHAIQTAEAAANDAVSLTLEDYGTDEDDDILDRIKSDIAAHVLDDFLANLKIEINSIIVSMIDSYTDESSSSGGVQDKDQLQKERSLMQDNIRVNINDSPAAGEEDDEDEYGVINL